MPKCPVGRATNLGHRAGVDSTQCNARSNDKQIAQSAVGDAIPSIAQSAAGDIMLFIAQSAAGDIMLYSAKRVSCENAKWCNCHNKLKQPCNQQHIGIIRTIRTPVYIYIYI